MKPLSEGKLISAVNLCLTQPTVNVLGVWAGWSGFCVGYKSSSKWFPSFPQESRQWAAGVLRTSSHLQWLLWRNQSPQRHFLRRVFSQGECQLVWLTFSHALYYYYCACRKTDEIILYSKYKPDLPNRGVISTCDRAYLSIFDLFIFCCDHM